jgi:bifunctional UDP-N-acetylglucosamine pyrophosphorylase / glucosamine-1-phosphate N-acetyltransferase
MNLSIVILAAGLGKRMHSSLPKVLHPIGGKPMLAHVVETAQTLKPKNIFIVYGHEGEQVRNALAQYTVQWVEQTKQLGTGHAVLQVMPHIPDDHRVLILLGDVPLVTTGTLQSLLDQTTNHAVGLVTMHIPKPIGLGRVLRDEKNNVIGVVEDKDATPDQRRIDEINTGIITAPAKLLRKWLPQLSNTNKQGEYYLPEIITKAIAENISVKAVLCHLIAEVFGINDRAQLAFLERCYQERVGRQLMLSGVTLKDPARFDVRGECDIASDVTIDVNVILEGKIKIGSGSIIGPNCVLRDVVIGDNVIIKANSIIEEAEIFDGCVVGPFARIRPGTMLKEKVHVGNFVEVKKSKIGAGSKVPHLSYIGNAVIGQRVNIGAGTITCNYDGVDKHQTIIEDDVFIGSDTQLVAPVTVSAGATIGAGSTIVKNAPANALTLSRAEQKTITGWKRKAKKKD